MTLNRWLKLRQLASTVCSTRCLVNLSRDNWDATASALAPVIASGRYLSTDSFDKLPPEASAGASSQLPSSLDPFPRQELSAINEAVEPHQDPVFSTSTSQGNELDQIFQEEPLVTQSTETAELKPVEQQLHVNSHASPLAASTELNSQSYGTPSEPEAGAEAGVESSESNIGKYFEFDHSTVPEAFEEYHQDPLLLEEGIKVKGGCKGLQEEFNATDESCLLYRSCMHKLISRVHQCVDQPMKSLLLTGPSGSGKSIALVTLVSWARAQGWLVAYVPSASEAMSGGTFVQDETDEMWDTEESATKIMKSVVDYYGEELKELESPVGQKIAELLTQGLESADPHEIVKCCVEFISLMPLLEEVPTLLAIDDYNALYSYSGYGQWLSDKTRVMLRGEELRLASALRVLDKGRGPPPVALPGDTAPRFARPPGWVGHAQVCALTTGHDISPRLIVPRGREHSHLFEIPRFDQSEVAAVVDWYQQLGFMNPASNDPVGQALHMTGGNARELRQYYHVLC